MASRQATGEDCRSLIFHPHFKTIVLLYNSLNAYPHEECDDTKEVIRIRKSKKGRHHNGQNKIGQKDKQRSTKHYKRSRNTHCTNNRG